MPNLRSRSRKWLELKCGSVPVMIHLYKYFTVLPILTAAVFPFPLSTSFSAAQL